MDSCPHSLTSLSSPFYSHGSKPCWCNRWMHMTASWQQVQVSRAREAASLQLSPTRPRPAESTRLPCPGDDPCWQGGQTDSHEACKPILSWPCQSPGGRRPQWLLRRQCMRNISKVQFLLVITHNGKFSVCGALGSSLNRHCKQLWQVLWGCEGEITIRILWYLVQVQGHSDIPICPWGYRMDGALSNQAVQRGFNQKGSFILWCLGGTYLALIRPMLQAGSLARHKTHFGDFQAHVIVRHVDPDLAA